MSSYEKPFKNDTQNFLQKNESPKTSSECKHFNFNTLGTSRSQEITNELQKTITSSEFSIVSKKNGLRELGEKLLPEITKWRRAVMEDKDAINQLKTLTGDSAKLLFRRQNVNELIETSYFPIVQLDSKDNLVSFTAYDSYPDLQSTPFSWREWLTNNYGIKGIADGNVLFMHYMVWHPIFEGKFLLLLLETLFTEFIHVTQIIVVKPPKADVPDFYSKYFIPVLPFGLENLEISSVQLLLVCLRSSVIHPLSIRTAFEQEFDVIMSVLKSNLNKTNTESTTCVWDFFNLFYQKDKKTLICEFEGQVVGTMILNLKINLDVLNEWFELAPYHGLKKKHMEEKNVIHESFSVPETTSSKAQKDTNNLISSEFLFSQMNWEMMLSKIQPNDSFLSEQDSSTSSTDSQFSQFSIFQLSSFIELDENEISRSSSHGKSETLCKMGGINLVIRTSESAMTHFFPPKYHGESNAFIIDFFAIDCNKVDEKLSSFDFLRAAFRIVPDREYCVLLIPTDLLPFPLLDLFVRVTPRLASNFKQELYLCHKNSLSIMSISVRSTKNTKDDLDSIKHFLKNMDQGDTVYQDILNNCFEENNSFKSFVLTFEEAIVGVSLLNSRQNIENFRTYYEIADFTSAALYETENFSVIKHLVVSPMYYNHARFFVRDIMRLEAVNCLYYACNKPPKNQPNILTVLGEFAPLKPKIKVGFLDPFCELTVPFSEKKTQEDCFSLYFLNPRLCGFHKIHMNIVIVVVGASRTALSFLESLIFGPESCFFNYNNIICVTTNSLETENDTDLKNLMFPNHDSFSKKYISMLSLETYVNFIYGIMTKINRSEKYIVVNNKAIIKYDYLILTCGLQYAAPTPEAKKILLKNRCQNNFTSSLARFLPRFSEKRKIYIPRHLNNMFIINTRSDAQNALRILEFLMQKIQKSGDKKIIVYGHDLQVFLTIHTLLKLGIPGEFIVFVEPFPSDTTTVTLFNDYSIDQAVLKSVRELKVKYYTNYILYDWSLSSEDCITAIKFHSSRKQIVIPCLAFFPFLEKFVSDVNFNACNSAGLVYDGKLVINHNFMTNDKHIYAAGPFTKYARRYFASEYNHQYYNSREVGQKLAEIIKRVITPMKENRGAEEESDLVPQLKAPVVLHCQLPGDFNLFILRKPGKEIDLETAYNFYNYGEVLTTGDCQMKNGFGYFRLHLNPQGFVESITCYTKDKIDYANLSSLYGLHERILNNLLLRFDLAMIPDLFAYFRQPWAMALFHEYFQSLRDYNSEAFLKKVYKNKSFCEKVIEELTANNWKSLPNSSKENLELKYLNSKTAEDVKNNLIQFLKYFKKDLPVYATTSSIKHLFREGRTMSQRHKTSDENGVDKKTMSYFPSKLQRFKPPLVPFSDLPSKVSLNEEYGVQSEKLEDVKQDLNTAEATKQEPVKAPITHWRRAQHSDREAVSNLIENCGFTMRDLFREPDVPNLIEKSSFALVQLNSNQEIISFTSIFPYPNIPAVPSFEWYPWLQNLYRLKDTTPRNSFYIHYMVWKSEYYHDFLRLALETIFLEINFLNNLIIMKPPKAKLPSIIPEHFIQVLPYKVECYDCDYNSFQTILLCLRHSLMERLKIRLAITEDHDDLMPIAEQHTDRLRQLYGNFCMAEIIEYPGTKDRRTLVCECMGYAVGFMILNRAADFELLNSQFELGVFNGLKKPTDRDKIAENLSDDADEKQVYLPEKIEPFLEIIDSEAMLKFLNWKPSLHVNEEELSEVDSTLSEKQETEPRELSNSMSNLIRGTLNVRLAPKFSAHALSLVESNSPKESASQSLSSIENPFDEDSTPDEEMNIQSEPSLVSLQYYNLNIYNGPPNAFLIEFFAMHTKFDDRLCRDFLEGAFEEFSDLEFCFLTVPSQAPYFPLLEYFVRVTPRPLKRFRQELYVCHRSSIKIKFMRVRKITKSDLSEVWKLLTGVQNQEFIYTDIASSCYYEDSPYQGFVLICSDSIIGAAVVCTEYGMEYLAHQFHVSDLIDFNLHKIDYHAILKHLIISPIYQPHARFFLRDIMRMADVTSLYKVHYEESENTWNKSSLINILSLLIPVKPRKMIIYHEPSLEPNIPPSYLRFTETPFSLYHINSSICTVKKLACNTNVVIVGTSTTAYSFLENLLFSPYTMFITYHNITWVAPHGMGTELPSHPARDLMFPFEGKYTRFYKTRICLKTYVHFVYGIMTQINRTDKYIVINNDFILPYDYLILLCGRQFMMPIPMSLLPNTKKCRRNFRPRCSLFKYLITQQPNADETNKTVYPSNIFLINTDVDATNAFISLQYLYQRKKNFLGNEKIIIYGHHISTYLCTQALLKYGILPNVIAIVEPFPSGTHSVSCFRDDNVDEAVLKTLNELGIDHYKGYFLYDWTLSDTNQIQSATFHSKRRKITIICLAMFSFERKSVSDVTFKAVNEASLVYDGKLVINNNFQTNDPNIYAAGGLTKYQRKYYAKNKNHQNYSSSEIGKHLANIIRNKLCPMTECVAKENSELVPSMTKPLILYGILPGDWHYLNVRKPGKFGHPETQAGIKEFGDVLRTGNCEMTNGPGYFRLSLDECGFVSQIICYTKNEIDVENLQMLHGKHEKLLNNLLLRFDLGMIKDFYSYFREPWVYAIFHDRFKFLMRNNTKLFHEEKTDDAEEKLIDLIVNTLKTNNWQRPPEEKFKNIIEKFENSKLQTQISQNILNFLYCFDEAFPMYATPRILRLLLHDATKSLLHKIPQDVEFSTEEARNSENPKKN